MKAGVGKGNLAASSKPQSHGKFNPGIEPAVAAKPAYFFFSPASGSSGSALPSV